MRPDLSARSASRLHVTMKFSLRSSFRKLARRGRLSPIRIAPARTLLLSAATGRLLRSSPVLRFPSPGQF
jgi:hypothetical protein